MMRVAELGLRALARERQVSLPRGRPVEWGTWQDILNEIDKGINGNTGIAKTVRSGPRKDAALEFYNGAMGHFLAFKDQYRNLVMHVREQYDSPRAESAMLHVREFMNGLSVRLTERTKSPIRWKF
jgi:hypothetical protein